MKDTSHLYSAMTSASLVPRAEAETKEKRQTHTKDRQEKRQHLKPHVQAIKEVFDKELHQLSYGVYLNEDTMTDDEFRRERQARRRAYEALTRVQGRINNILRAPRLKDDPLGDKEIEDLIDEA